MLSQLNHEDRRKHLANMRKLQFIQPKKVALTYLTKLVVSYSIAIPSCVASCTLLSR
uniref:Uncharacterized protein n=1 Tax=Arundo donax TaxID=35708 RepID=A0A0A9AJV7_ARUDO